MTLRITSYLAGLLLAGVSLAAFASFTASVDQTRISQDDLVTLTLRLSNENTSASPDFSGIRKDFAIVQQSGPNQSSEFTFINGKQSSETHTDWTLTLQPKRIGLLTIPAIRLGNEATQPIAIEVLPGNAVSPMRPRNHYVFFETSVDHHSVYVQGQIIFTEKLFYVDSISGSFPAAPNIDNAVVQPVEKEKRYQSVVDGHRYYVLEKSYAIYPQQSGTLVIPSQRFHGTRGSASFFAPSQPVSAISRQHTIHVKPAPAAFTNPNWLPAQGLTLRESWGNHQPQFKVGDPVNRTLTLTARGVAASLLPSFPKLHLANAKSYADPPTTSNQTSERYGIIGTESVTVGIVPTKPGKLTLPEIRVPWWNTTTNKMQVAVIPAETYTIAAAPGSSVTIPQAPPANTQAPANTSQPKQVVTYIPSKLWLYVLAALVLLWLISTWQWLSTRRQLNRLGTGDEPAAPPVRNYGVSEDNAWDLFSRACKSGNADRASKALFVWGKSRYPNIHTLRDLGAIGGEHLTTEIIRLENALYAPQSAADWQGDTLLDAASQLHKAKQEKPKRTALADALNPR